MIRVALFALALIAPAPAFALSCLAPSVERSYAQYDAAEETYVVVHGRLTLNEKLLPKGLTVDRDPPAVTRVPAKLLGKSLTKRGFTLPYEQDVMLEVICLGPWCGGARNGEDVLAFVRKDADGYTLEVGPCGGAVFGTPKPEMLKQARKCLQSGACTTE